jgi:Ca-activated chloride channel family protein
MDDRGRRAVSQVIAVVVGILLILFLRGVFAGDDGGGGNDPGLPPNPDNCLQLFVTASSEKAALLATMADGYNRSGAEVAGRCVQAVVTSKASGGAMDALARGWRADIDGPRPDVWTPASSSWVGLLRQRAAARDRPDLVPDGELPRVASSPLVIAMPRPMAQALGWPGADIGWSDIYELSTDPEGWGSVGHPEWGAFRLGKTNPYYSTSGLNALIGEYFAATGLSSDLSLTRLEEPKVRDFVRAVESSVVHYGDTTLTFLSNMQQADEAGEGLTYISAATVEEKSVWDYNQGNPTGDPATLGDRAEPSVPLVAIYPEEGTLISDHPWVTLDAPWVDAAKRDASASFLEWVLAPEQQTEFQSFAFRTADGEAGDLITQDNGLLPAEPKQVLAAPAPEVLDRIQTSWTELRKRAQVLLVIDVSGSMADPAGGGSSKLELAKDAAIDALTLFAPDDDVGLWVFTTDMAGGADYQELIPVGPLGPNIDEFRRAISGLVPLNGTPLYTAVHDSVEALRARLDPDRINGVVVLTDGRNEDPRNQDLEGLLRFLDSELNVRVFPIAYGEDADLATLTRIAQASRAAVYDASDPATISKVFVSVISNF